jgi:hypothetical protein
MMKYSIAILYAKESRSALGVGITQTEVINEIKDSELLNQGTINGIHAITKMMGPGDTLTFNVFEWCTIGIECFEETNDTIQTSETRTEEEDSDKEIVYAKIGHRPAYILGETSIIEEGDQKNIKTWAPD